MSLGIGQVVDDFPVDFIPGADLDGFEAVEDIEFGDGETGESIEPAGKRGRDGIKPTASAGTACGCPEFRANGTEFLSIRIEKLGGEWPPPD